MLQLREPVRRPAPPATARTPTNLPDVPWDQNCTASPCTGKYSPTFWSTTMLAKVHTQLLSGSSYTDVETWTLGHTFPNPGDGTSAALWFNTLSHSGLVGGTVTVPTVYLRRRRDAEPGLGGGRPGAAQPLPSDLRHQRDRFEHHRQLLGPAVHLDQPAGPAVRHHALLPAVVDAAGHPAAAGPVGLVPQVRGHLGQRQPGDLRHRQHRRHLLRLPGHARLAIQQLADHAGCLPHLVDLGRLLPGPGQARAQRLAQRPS